MGTQVHKGFLTSRSLSVILPAHNEEAVIAQTIQYVLETLTPWVADFEIIVVNDLLLCRLLRLAGLSRHVSERHGVFLSHKVRGTAKQNNSARDMKAAEHKGYK